jgi:heme/copper-type cytochrome/quinol oxidase subunit 2
MPDIAGLSFWTFLTITIVGGLIVLFVILYGVLWFMARNYRNKHNLHGDAKDYEDVIKQGGNNG